MRKQLFVFGAWLVRTGLDYAIHDPSKRKEIIDLAQSLVDDVRLLLVEVEAGEN